MRVEVLLRRWIPIPERTWWESPQKPKYSPELVWLATLQGALLGHGTEEHESAGASQTKAQLGQLAQGLPDVGAKRTLTNCVPCEKYATQRNTSPLSVDKSAVL